MTGVDLAGGPDRTVVTTWRKACTCKATATTNATRTSRQYPIGPDRIGVEYVLIPGPSCDGCGKPWTMQLEPDP